MAEILLLGGPQSGKSALLRHLRQPPSAASPPEPYSETALSPTVGVEMFSVPVETLGSAATPLRQVVIREVGSCMALRWQSYLPTADAVLFMVDVSDTSSMAATLLYLYEVLVHKGSRALAILLNKGDLCDAEGIQTVRNVLRLEEITAWVGGGSICLLTTGHSASHSCLDDSARAAVIAWLLKEFPK